MRRKVILLHSDRGDPYTFPRLFRCASAAHPRGNLNKRWFVMFDVWDENVKKMVRKRIYAGLTAPTVTARELQAEHLIDKLSVMLKTGYRIEKKKEADPDADLLRRPHLLAAMEWFLKKKQRVLKNTSYRNYRQLLVYLYRYLKQIGRTQMLLSTLDSQTTERFLDWLVDDDRGAGVSNRTRNNTARTLTTFVRFMHRRNRATWGYVLPTDGISMLPQPAGKHSAFSSEEIRLMKSEMIARGEGQLLLFCSFIFYALIRPGELERMRVRQISLPAEEVFIPASDAKNATGQRVDIYPPLKALINKHRICDYPSDYYVFSADGQPSMRGPVSHSYILKRHRKVLVATGLHSTERRYDVYSWKHTGVVQLYEAGVDIMAIMAQCRHSSLETTQKYLRDLGLFREKQHFSLVRKVL